MPRNGKKNPRSRGPRSQRGGWSVPRPPQFVATIRSLHRFRWLVGTAGTYPVTSTSMLNWYVVATAATTTARPIDAARLRRVSIWGQPPALGAAATTIELDWKGSNPTDAKHADTSSGISPAFFSVKPPKNSSSSWWYDNSSTSTSLFTLVAPVGTTVDVEVELLFVDDSAAISGPATTGASLGQFYGTTLTGVGQAVGSGVTPVGITALP